MGASAEILGRASVDAMAAALARVTEAVSAEEVLMSEFSIGDHVLWNSEAGFVSGVITRLHTQDFEFKGYMRRCSVDEPQYEIESDKTDHVAIQKAKVLTKIA
ncbi:MAG: DUF2945 domain-containing protein [Rhodoglobus sp.]